MSAYADQDPVSHSHRHPMRRHGLCPAVGAHHQIQFGVDSLHRGLFAALRRAVRAAADGRRLPMLEHMDKSIQ